MFSWTLRYGVLVAAIAVAFGVFGERLSAHPTPYSYVDVRMHRGGIDVSIAAHIVDVGNELGFGRPEDLLGPVAPPNTAALIATLLDRARLRVDGRDVMCGTTAPYERDLASQVVRWALTCDGDSSGRTLTVRGPLFPYDAEHQMFVTVYVDDGLIGQVALSEARRDAVFSIREPQTRGDTFRRFLASGIEHIVSGPDHLLFLAGLFLMGGTLARLAAIVTAFTVAHSVTLVLAALDIVAPPATLIEPLIALSIVYVGVQNIRSAGSSEWRILTAGIFGLIHGFGFAYVLREMQLPPQSLVWSLFSFNVGVEVGQLVIVLGASALLLALRRSQLVAERNIVVAGSIGVAAVGAYWFVERVVTLSWMS